MRSGFLGRGIGPSAFGGGGQTASWQVTTTGAETLTIAAFTVSAATVVDWGDGSSDTYSGAGARTHNYAGAGTWTVRVMQPGNVTALALNDNKVILNSSGIASMTNMATFELTAAKSGAFNSADVAGWRPSIFQLISMPAGFTGTFNSADVAAWRPINFQLYNMPAGYACVFNSADVAGWRPLTYIMYAMPNTTTTGTFNTTDVSGWRPSVFFIFRQMPASYTFIVSGGMENWTTANYVDMGSNAFSQAQVDAILYSLYRASIAPRTASGGTIILSGTNAAPSGTFQACASPPVSAATPGKEIAYELLNDSLGLFNNWATVTITA